MDHFIHLERPFLTAEELASLSGAACSLDSVSVTIAGEALYASPRVVAALHDGTPCRGDLPSSRLLAVTGDKYVTCHSPMQMAEIYTASARTGVGRNDIVGVIVSALGLTPPIRLRSGHIAPRTPEEVPRFLELEADAPRGPRVIMRSADDPWLS